MDKIAIIGTACLFPGAETPEAYWENLVANKDSRISADVEHMGRDAKDYFSPHKDTKDKYYCTTGGYIQDFHFDGQGYALEKEKLQGLDNTFLWALHVCREALKDSGYSYSASSKDNKLSRCGVILGNLSFPTKKSNKLFLPLYHQAMSTPLKDLFNDPDFKMGEEPMGDLDNGTVAGLPASIISQALSLGDVSMVLDAACASSLYSMKLACSYLLSHKADMMLAGAVSSADPWFVSMGFSTFKAFPENVISRPLDKNSTGLNTGEGAGMFVLKRYQDAVRDGDTIHAVINGIGLSNDGKGKFVLSPNQAGQVTCYERAYKDTAIDPSDVDYIECHATGTPLGDETEIHSMEQFFADKDIHFSMGTAKSNLGHLLTSAGMAGMLKIILAMKNDLLPATINVQDPLTSEKKNIAGDNILTKNKQWPASDAKKKVAAISAFGFGGTNAHLILEQHNQKDKPGLLKQHEPRAIENQAISIVGMGAYFGQDINLSELENTIYQSRQRQSVLPEKRWQGIEKDSSIVEKFGLSKFQEQVQGNFIEQFDFDHLYFKIPPEQQAPLLPQQLLMMKVLDEALQNSSIAKGGKKGGNIGVIVAMEMDLGIHQFRGRIDVAWQLQESLRNSNISLSEEQQSQLTELLKDSLHNAVEINQFTSFIGNIIPCRICSLWDFSGPAFTISSEENSVFKALEVAKLFLESGDVDAMVVGAVDLSGGFENIYLQNQRNTVNSSTKSSLSFEAGNNGWTIGEGAGAVVLKRSDQIEDNEHVYANIDAFSGGYSSSDYVKSLQQASDDALQQAGIDSDQIDYIELNSSGMQNQDESEIAALAAHYKKRTPDNSCALGSVKANVGHSFAASGIASLIKTALCLYNRFIPGIPNWEKPKHSAQWQDQQFYFPQQSRPWLINQGKDKAVTKKRYAAINSLGQDKSVYHLILSDQGSRIASKSASKSVKKQIPESHFFEHLAENQALFLFPIAAQSESELQTKLTQLENEISSSTSLKKLALDKLADYQLLDKLDKPNQVKSKYRLSLLARSADELQKQITTARSGITESISSGEEWSTPLGSYFTPTPQAEKGKVAFVYPGGFNSYIGMARDVFQMFPELIDKVAGSTSCLKKMMRTHYVYPETVNAPDKKAFKQLEAEMGDDAVAMFESGIMTSIVYTKLIQDLLGVKPGAAFGHSMGELSMLFSSGAWDNTDYMSETLHSTATFHNRLVGDMDVVRKAWDLPPAKEGDAPIWGTYTLRTSAEKAQPVIAEEERVFLIIVNAPNEIVIAGDDAACKRVVKKLKWRLFPVPIKDVVHNELVLAEFDALEELHTMPTTAIKGVDFYTAADYKKTQMKAEVIGNNIATFYTHMVDFPKLVNQVYDDGARIFIELGPQSSCSKWVSESLKGQDHLAVSINRKGVDDYTSLLRLAAKLTSHGIDIDLAKLFPKPALQKQAKPALIKPVVLGKQPFADVIVTDENRTKFAPQKKLDKLSKQTIMPPIKPSKPEVIAAAIAEPSISISIPLARTAPEQTVKQVVNQKTAPVLSHSVNTENINSNTVKSVFMPTYQSEMLQKMFQHNINISEMHADFMQSRSQGLQTLTNLILDSIKSPGGQQFAASKANISSTSNVTAAPSVTQQLFPTEYSAPEHIVFTEQDLREVAYGKIGKVFGPDYDIIDTYSRRVMLPMDPYLLVTRVTEMQAEKGEYKPSKMTTEYDIPHNAWYSTDGQIPTCICIESGQCDLLLISYMGIDFENKGEYVYRLLDCTLTFLDDQPKEGQTLRYEISINSFAQHKNNLLFFFSYECFIGDKMILKMDNGCAGFFSDEELAVGKGVIHTKDEISERGKVTKSSFTPILQCQKTSFDRKDIQSLMDGDLAACYANPAYDKQGKNPSLHFPLEKIMMLDRITSVHRTGGLWGLGLLEAEKDLFPDEWYFTSHFRDDPVLAGSLMSEGCVQLLQFFMLYLGLHTRTEDARFQTMRNIPQPIRCRGQALPKDRLMTYRLEVTEIGLSSNGSGKPYARGNVDIIIDGKIVVDFRDVCLELSEKSEHEKQLLQFGSAAISVPAQAPAAAAETLTVETLTVETLTVETLAAKSTAKLPIHKAPIHKPQVKPALFTEQQIVHFATGDIEACFGPEFAVYKQPPAKAGDPPRRPPRTPNSYLQVMHRVLDVTGNRHDFENTTKCTAEYDVAEDVWFCTENSYPSYTPYSMLMEIALQPNGFLTSHIGSTLMYPDINLYFRNLDGTGRLLKEIDLRGKTIVNKTTMFSTSAVMNNIIQKFTFELICDGETFYEGDAVFGFFSAESLSNQVGMDKGKKLLPWYLSPGENAEKIPEDQLVVYYLNSEQAKKDLYEAKNNKPFYHLAGGMLDFLDESIVVPDGGKFGKGYVHSMNVIDAGDWFYPCHFYKDPVMPGSLGVEAMIQSIQVYALQQDLGKDLKNPRFGLVEDEAKWTYRGQIIPDNKVMTLEIHIKEIRKTAHRVDILVDGNLWKDGLRIYSVESIGLSIQEAQ